MKAKYRCARKDEEDCPAMKEGYLCTREKGHGGEHEAHNIHDKALERWT